MTHNDPVLRDAPAFHRNRQPVLEVLAPRLGAGRVDVLEIASGSGQHGPFITEHCPDVVWWPSDIDDEALASITGWAERLEARHVMAPVRLDVAGPGWRKGEAIEGLPERFDVIFNMNMIHISPWCVAEGLFEGAGKRLKEGGFMMLYGPFLQSGVKTAPGNIEFDRSLKARNSDWGIRQLDDVKELAAINGLEMVEVIAMPANNLSVILTRQDRKNP